MKQFSKNTVLFFQNINRKTNTKNLFRIYFYFKSNIPKKNNYNFLYIKRKKQLRLQEFKIEKLSEINKYVSLEII